MYGFKPINFRCFFSRINPFIRKTNFSFSEAFSKILDASVFFKLENQQFTGSFKARGALNKILTLNESGKSISSVISASTGNHGAAVAYAARQAKIECNIYVPEGSSKAKLSNMKNYGATINIFGSDCVEAEAKKPEKYLKKIKFHMFLPTMIFTLWLDKELWEQKSNLRLMN